ncbi:hypothetical protein Desaci_0313 [Desulfosporosinus acidiphilus SJ4]|uniref:Uncharacterized protein n=1 Tax=Desulfosporosinus acidiphilus (strain DSM 22704 / JCM 16185 / SJ4) TaxID=646529 RepID=I4D0R1_DESAJ|nr:hypothetical protein [Desulfosporosinus acidiphilus]AFM39385.1 hypothetical protein Desaci_0313 [Desulfosporosinus acidiphilus SJ4]
MDLQELRKIPLLRALNLFDLRPKFVRKAEKIKEKIDSPLRK